MRSVADGSVFGNTRPRIELANHSPAIFWMESPSNLWYSKSLSDSTFTEPMQLAAIGHDVFVSGYGGADIATYGDNVFLVYMTKPFNQAKVYFRKSTDGGETWGLAVNFSLNHIIPFLPTVSFSDNGNPTIMLMGYDTNYTNPAYYTFTSLNGGNSFGSGLKVSAGTPHEVCDCCPAHLSLEGDVSVALFRNNDQNLRDLWAATSIDNGISIDTAQDIDPNNWQINSCPSSGPDAILNEGDLHAVWMSAGSGSSRVYRSNLEVQTQNWSTELIYDRGNNQNYPRISGNSDTIGIVFQNNEDGINNCLFIYSVDGGSSFSEPFDLFGDSTSIQTAPDLVYKNKTFHFVFRDLFSSDLIYRSARFESTLDVQDELESIRLFPNPVEHEINFSSTIRVNDVKVYNMLGQEFIFQLVGGKIDVSSLRAGIYVISFGTGFDSRVMKFEKR